MPDFINLQSAAETGLSIRKLHILGLLEKSPGSISSLSSRTRHVRQLISNDLDSLTEAGLVEEKTPRVYTLTPKGVELFTSLVYGGT